MTKATRWAWIVSLVAATGGALVLAFLLSVATNSPTLVERHYVWLFWVNVAVAALLVLVIAIVVVRLALRVRRGKFGSRLLLKLAAIFALVGLAPGVLIYTVSYQFAVRSVATWFDAKVESALDAGLVLGRGTLDALTADLAAKTRIAAERLPRQPASQPLALERLREELLADEVAIVGGNGQTLLTTGGTAGTLIPQRPSGAMLRQARALQVTAQVEGLDEDGGGGTGARIRALARIPTASLALDAQERFLFVTQALAPSVATNALAVQAAYREYQQRALARDGLLRMTIGALTLALVLAVLGALVLAVMLSNQIVRPLLLLADGVRQVARGDLSVKPVFASRDELGGLTRSFADMTAELSDARALVQRSVAQVDAARANLQTILDNLTAGVIVFDREGRIETVNPGATRIVRVPIAAYRGQRLETVPGLAAFAAAVWERFAAHARGPEAGERDHWQDAFELTTADGRDTLTLLVRGAAMPQGARLMVFDDITELVSAQRSEAWAEVARRLAHEIKNPLTPIQLSAERLQLKLEPKLDPADRGMLERSVATIVAQVQSMKALVNEFRDYARLPAAQLKPLDLNALVAEVLALYGSAHEAGRLAAVLGPELPAILGDATQLRQVIHNLVGNALDAIADREGGRVVVRTELRSGEAGDAGVVRLTVQDNGPGFAEKVLRRAFEPYVTTKAKGTGLGLAVVKKIADEHGARVHIANLPAGAAAPPDHPSARGAQVSL